MSSSRRITRPLLEGYGRGKAALLILLVLGGCWLGFWAAVQHPGSAFGREAGSYYELLTQGFRSGHLYVAIEPNPALLTLKNPYDPVANAPYRVHDMSLWQGKYYLYFGVTPNVILFWPVLLLTGFYPTEPFAVALFAAIGFCAGAGLLVAVRRRYYPSAPAWVAVAGVACLIFASPVLLLAPASQFYQVPIACAFGLHLLMLAAIYRSVHCARRGMLWLGAASLLFGLAVGARPNYLPGGFALALVWLWRLRAERRERGRWAAVRVLPWTAAAFGPAAAYGTGLLLYNWLRFGSAAEFGMHYELAGSSQTDYVPFALSNFWTFGRVYLFGGSSWSPYFPFFSPPGGSTQGMLRYVPWVWLAVAALIPWRADAAPANRGRRIFSRVVFVAGLVNLALLTSFSGVNDRYMCDIVPTWIVLGALGALALGAEGRLAGGRGRGVLAAAVVLAAGVSIGISQAALFRRLPQQERFTGIVRLLNWPTSAWQRIRGEEQGALRLVLDLPKAAAGTVEPLFQTGRTADQRDWLLIEYLDGNRARVGFFHAGLGLLQGGEFPIPADRRVTVETRCGSLLPPFAHPFFASWSRDDYATFRRDLQVKVNGAEVLRAMLDCYESAPQDLLIGRLGWPSGGILERFSGSVAQAARLPLERVEAVAPVLTQRAPIELTLFFPLDKQSGTEPLFFTGRGEQSDLLYGVYESGNRVSFGLDHYGNGGPRSESVEFDPLQPHVLTVWMGSLAGGASAAPPPAGMPDWDKRLVVLFDGRPVLNLEQIFYAAPPESAVVGYNLAHSSVAIQRFSGRIISSRTGDFATLPILKQEGEYGPVDMAVVFPTHVMGVADPLVVTGDTGAGDMLYVRYVDNGRVVFGFDHWGIGGMTSQPVPIDYGRPHRLELTMGSLYAGGGSGALRTLVRIRLDGKTVMEGQSPCHPSAAAKIRLGKNPIGGSTCGPVFNGKIISVSRAAQP